MSAPETTAVLVATPGRTLSARFLFVMVEMANASPVPTTFAEVWEPSYSVAGRRNQLAEAFLQSEEFSHLLMVDEDGHPPRDIIARLLAMDAPLASPLIFSRHLGRGTNFEPLDEELRRVQGREAGVIGARAVGTACLLIRRDVLETLPRPWFLGDDLRGGGAEDIRFGKAAIDAGFEIKVDTDIIVPHKTAVWLDVHSIQAVWEHLPAGRRPGEDPAEARARLTDFRRDPARG